MHRMIRTAALLAPLALFAADASAAFTYQYVAEQGNYNVDVSQSTVLPVKVYLQENTDGAASQIAADGGMFSAGVKVSRSSGTATLANQIDASPEFTSSNTSFGATEASLFEDNVAASSGPSPIGGRLYLGTFYVDVGSVGGLTSSFNLLDYGVGDQLVTFQGRPLDPVTTAGSFSVVTVIPEPAGTLLLLLAPTAALLRRRRRGARVSL